MSIQAKIFQALTMKLDKIHNNTISEIKIKDETKEFKGWGYRHQQCLILFFCLTTAYSMRACMGVALVDMVYRKNIGQNFGHVPNTNITNFLPVSITPVSDVQNETHSNISRLERAVDSKENRNDGFLHSLLLIPPYYKFEWDKSVQDIILSSFFWGYMLLQIPAGQLAYRFGARFCLSTAMLINCIVSFCFPWAVYYGGWILAVIFRIIQGLSQACIFPGMHTMLGKWTTVEERGRLAGWAYGGQALGPVLGLPITGYIASSPLGWPGIFRFYGILSGLAGLVIWIFGANSPAQHSRISTSEREFIEERLGHVKQNAKKKNPVPWAKMLRSHGLWAIVVAHIGQTWVQLTLYTEVPAFMDKVMGVNIKANGLLTAFPFFVMWLTNFFFTWFTDMLIVKKYLSVTNTRKLANSLGCIPAAIGLVILAYVPKEVYAVEIMLVFICAFKISCQVGFQVNHIDISNNYSGTMISISNFVSNLCGSQAPLIAGLILTDVSSEFLWRKVFFVAAGIYFGCNLFYVIFGTAEKADWDNPVVHTGDRLNETEVMIKKEDTNNSKE